MNVLADVRYYARIDRMESNDGSDRRMNTRALRFAHTPEKPPILKSTETNPCLTRRPTLGQFWTIKSLQRRTDK
jgi:hypothetical protein